MTMPKMLRLSLPSFITLGLGAGLWGALGAWSNAQTVPTASPTPLNTQVARGEQVFKGSCQKCHGDQLQGTRGPTLLGSAFLAHWKTVGDLHAKVSQTMPRSAPATLKPQEYLDVVAFILNKNQVKLPTRGVNAKTFNTALVGK